MTKEQIDELRLQAEEGRLLYNSGLISREDAIERISPYIRAYNEKCLTIAKKYNVKPKKISFAVFVR